jgi:hypothetical protein
MHFHKTERPVRRSRILISTSNQRIEALRQLMELEQRRSALQSELDEIFAKSESLQTEIFSQNSADRNRLATPTNHGSQPSAPRVRRMGRGELRMQIVDSLRAAGEKGVLVKELSALLRMKSVNIHSWFHSAIRRFPQIKKAGPGRYVLVSELNLPETPLNRRMVRDHTEAAMTASKNPRPKRGEITRLINQSLELAGQNGMSVQELAARIGANYRNVHVWFSSTGKKNPLIEKVGRGKYRLMKRGKTAALQSLAV